MMLIRWFLVSLAGIHHHYHHHYHLHLGAQVLICCTCDAHIQKSNEAGLFEFMCKLNGRYDAVDVGLEPVKAVSFDDCERVIHIAEPKFGHVLTL